MGTVLPVERLTVRPDPAGRSRAPPVTASRRPRSESCPPTLDGPDTHRRGSPPSCSETWQLAVPNVRVPFP